MAVTQTQQYLADTKAAQNPQACCLALGGTITTDDENQQICVAVVNGSATSFYLSDACSYAGAVAQTSPTQGGGILGWISQNVGTVGTAVSNIIGTVTGQPTPQQQIASLQAEQEAERQRQNRRLVVGLVIFAAATLILIIYLKNRKK